MPRPLVFGKTRVVRLTVEADDQLIKIAVNHNTTPTQKAREYVEAGIRRDMTGPKRKKL